MNKFSFLENWGATKQAARTASAARIEAETVPEAINPAAETPLPSIEPYISQLNLTHPLHTKTIQAIWGEGREPNTQNPIQTAVALFHPARLYKHLPISKKRKALRTILDRRLPVWESCALPLLPSTERELKNINFFDPRGIANITLGLHYAGLKPSDGFLERLFPAIAMALPYMNGQETANTGLGLAGLGLTPPEHILTPFLNKLNNPETALNTQEKPNTLYTLSVWAAIDPALQHTLTPYAQRLICDPRNLSEMRQIYDACQLFGFAFSIPPTQIFSSSKYEVNVCKAFQRAAFQKAPSKFIPRLGKEVDMTFNANGTHPALVVEVDGFPHFVLNRDPTQSFNGSTILQTALLRKTCTNAAIIRVAGGKAANYAPEALKTAFKTARLQPGQAYVLHGETPNLMPFAPGLKLAR